MTWGKVELINLNSLVRINLELTRLCRTNTNTWAISDRKQRPVLTRCQYANAPSQVEDQGW
jgi:hypothetical protein